MRMRLLRRHCTHDNARGVAVQKENLQRGKNQGHKKLLFLLMDLLPTRGSHERDRALEKAH